MWHASVSIQRKGRWVDDPARLERLAITALRGVGGITEWWICGLRLIAETGAVVGHLRVPVTDEEFDLIPGRFVPVADAGETGPQRLRTK